MREVVKAILLDPEARGDVKTDPNYGKLREPIQYITGILRGFNAASDGVIGNRSQDGDLPLTLDQPLFQPTTVFSYYQALYRSSRHRNSGPRVWNSFDLDDLAPRQRGESVGVSRHRDRNQQSDRHSVELYAARKCGRQSGRSCRLPKRAAAARHDVDAGAHFDHHGDERDSGYGCELPPQAVASRGIPGNDFVSVRHTEITIMAPSRRDFLRTGACALGGMALASTLDSFGRVYALTPQQASDYRALVCIFLNGGNDGNNMVVDLGQYNSYATARGVDLAIPQANLLQVSPVTGGSYGFHPNLTGLRDLFNMEKLAVLSNNGPLVEPLTKTTYQNGTGKKPLQLFSHSDQVGLFQTSIANVVSQTGWGGRVADTLAGLNGSATFPQNISIAGINLLLTGVDTRQLAVADSNTTLANVLQLIMTSTGHTTAEVNARTASFNELRNYDRNFTLIKAASDTRTSAIQTDVALSTVNPTLTTVFPNTSLGRQLLQVARLIKACTDPAAGINMKRQIFFCQIGGFDTHSNQTSATFTGAQGNLMTQVSAAMSAFYDATVELELANKVTAFTLSDFSRTLQPAGTGAPKSAAITRGETITSSWAARSMVDGSMVPIRRWRWAAPTIPTAAATRVADGYRRLRLSSTPRRWRPGTVWRPSICQPSFH